MKMIENKMNVTVHLEIIKASETEPMTIIYQTTEDDADDTVVPRFNSAGGNGENLIFIKEDEKLYLLEITALLKQSKSITQSFSLLTQ